VANLDVFDRQGAIALGAPRPARTPCARSGSGALRKARRGQFTAEVALSACAAVAATAIRPSPIGRQASDALDIAFNLDHAAYDCH